MRVLFLGDLVAFGYGQKDYEHVFPNEVQPLIAQRLKQPVETINASTPGFGTWQERRYLVREGIKYQPDLVIVAFVLNDFIDNMGSQTLAGVTGGWELTHMASSWVDNASAEAGRCFSCASWVSVCALAMTSRLVP